MKPRSIASTLATVSLGAFFSACGGADVPDGSASASNEFAGQELTSNYEEVAQEVTSCDDHQYDHWRYLSALAVASANELGRWDISDFSKVGGKIALSSSGLARCSRGCEDIVGILQMQNDETRIVPRHDPGLLRQYMIAFYDRQVNFNRTNPSAPHALTLAGVSDDVCGLRYHFDVDSPSTSTTVTGLSGTTEFKPTSQYRCMDIVGVSGNDGATVQQYSCSGGANQKFTVEAQGNNNYRLKANHSGKCLGVANNATHDGALIEQRSCGANNSQLFQLNNKGNGLFEIRNVNSGKCMDVKGGGYSDGALIQLYSCHGGANQTFATSGLNTSAVNSTSGSAVNPASLWSRLKFAGEHDNKYLMFQSTQDQVSIDPMGTMITGGSSSSSGACTESSTTRLGNADPGDCCVVSGRYGKFVTSPWNSKTLLCKY